MTKMVMLCLVGVLGGCVDPADDSELDEVEQAVALPGYEVVGDVTAYDGAGSKQLRVECPEGKQALGAGWQGLDTRNMFMHAVATYSAPSADGRSWTIGARNVSGWGSGWKLHVEVSCVTARRSYQIVTADSSYGQVEVTCPRGTVSTGGGFGLLGRRDAILDGEATYYQPGWDGKSWLINAHATGGPSSQLLRGFAVCLAPADLPGYQVVTAYSVLDPLGYKQLIASCPPATVPTGAGWAILDSTGAIIDASGLRHSWWGPDGWLTNAGPNGYAGDFKLQLRLLCVQ